MKSDKTVKAQQVMAREVGTMMIGNVFLSKVFVCSRNLMGLKYRVFAVREHIVKQCSKRENIMQHISVLLLLQIDGI